MPQAPRRREISHKTEARSPVRYVGGAADPEAWDEVMVEAERYLIIYSRLNTPMPLEQTAWRSSI